MPKSDTAFRIGQRAALAGDMVETESAQIKAEMRAILDAVLDLGDGDPALTPMRGFRREGGSAQTA
jgi:glutamate mutase epsilon subunit